MPHLLRQTDHGGHHPTGQDPAKEHRQRQAENEPHHHDREQHALTLFKIALILE
ncbi:hypothetical protein D3C81_2160600 [compost metagenome]